ncbi:MAG: exo-alpha-sialidase [Rhodoferax sp.]|nr:exo-alpha-sialidase [Rhodoferax sp.]
MRLHARWQRVLVALAVACLVSALDAGLRSSPPVAAQATWPVSAEQVGLQDLRVAGKGQIPRPAGALAAHASYLLAMPKDHAAALTAFWFAGDRESAPNVQIAAAQWDRRTQQWTQARYVVNRHAMGDALGFGLRRLGNPVAWLDGKGRMHLFVVATGLGGWAAGRVLHLRQNSAASDLQALQFAPVRVLPLSWLWNTSYLVRNAPLQLADGGMVLPAYFEIGIKYPTALRFDSDGNFVGMQRISARTWALQPTLLAQSPSQWLALMRDTRPNGRVITSQTQDGGKTWADVPDLALVNPDSATAGVSLTAQDQLLVHNSAPASREKLDLSYSADGVQWRKLLALEDGVKGEEFSYPSMAWTDGALWVSYTTDDRKSIAWQKLVPSAVKGTP